MELKLVKVRAGRASRQLALLTATAGALAFAPTIDSASAANTVSALPGRVAISTDDNPHQLEVWTSRRDVSARDWALKGAVWAGAGLAAARAQMAEWDRWEAKVQNAILEGMQAMPSLENAPAPVRALAKRYETARLYMEEKATILRRFMKETSDSVRNPAISVNATMAKIRQSTQYSQAFFEASEFAEKLAAELLDVVDRSLLWGERLAQSVGLSLERFGWASRTMSRFVKIGLWLGPVLSAVEMFSSHQVLVRDTADNPLTAIPPCTDHVRKLRTDGTYELLPNTVSCPSPDALLTLDPTNLFGLLGYVSLNVTTGGGRDTVSLRLTEEGSNPFADVFVDTGDGNDTIVGSEDDDELRGGAGNDEIFGRGGDDHIYGYDGSFAPLGGVLDNDTLFGHAGNDTIYGEWGHDKIFGGQDDDRNLLRAALVGGQGNDVIVGGPGSDRMQGGDGRDTLLGRESAFGQADENDGAIDCGPSEGPGEQYVTFNTAEGGNVFNCIQPPPKAVTAGVLLDPRTQPDALGNWPWFR